ncbi:SURF1 family protein [Rhodanobacter sp. DHG33]|uniref:SURF1 family protein n=1 Tax=Rhodanobacter sp. DHG33 TaxID=2775921 RepID=UPI001781A928|nr:SURF1 family protein [Rhodanobacter sp. DHG33]MBD8897675.1 SURF1 family protein [Rhodanobacter sp. DHG33]
MPDTSLSFEGNERHVRGPVALTLLALLGVALFSAFVALGSWQVHRLAWKTALIAHVDERVHAPPVPAPGPAEWPRITEADDAYRHVLLTGTWLPGRQVRVWTATAAGSGYWILAPLRRDDGSIVLVNRGFAPEGWCNFKGDCPAAPSGEVTVTGLLRISEPSGWIPHNDAATDTWYTRDVPVIAKARGLANVAPYFVDADAGADASAWPRGGLTVVQFPNHHLNYLITWYLLALMVLGAAGYVARDEYRLRKRLKSRR